jgi:hypothetical protein
MPMICSSVNRLVRICPPPEQRSNRFRFSVAPFQGAWSDPRGAVDAAGSEDPADVAAVSTSDDRRPRKMKLLPVKSLLTA